jgi:hypothetical protein
MRIAGNPLITLYASPLGVIGSVWFAALLVLAGTACGGHLVAASGPSLTSPGANLQVVFSDSGVQVTPLTKGGCWNWAYKLTHVGRSDALTPVRPAGPIETDSRVEFQRGNVTEWYHSRLNGIEQGYVIHLPPAGEGEIVLVGNWDGSVKARLDDAGTTVRFYNGNREVMRYGNLEVWDANSQLLASYLSLEGDRIVIHIKEEGVYPILVDPLLTTPSWTVMNEDLTSLFGNAVAGAGDVNNDGYDDFLVGAVWWDQGIPEPGGKAYLYPGSSAGLDTLPAWTYTYFEEPDAYFGMALDGAGDVNGDGYDDVVVSAPSANDFDGRAYVFYGSSSGLASTPSQILEGEPPGNSFGWSLAGAGDVNGDGYDDIVVGAPHYNGSYGAAYVFHGSASGVNSDAAWSIYAEATNFLGEHVSCAGDVDNDGYSDVLVGEPGYYDVDTWGRVLLFLGGAAGLSSTPAWSAVGDQNAGFGKSFAGLGDVNGDGYADVAVGDYSYDTPSNNCGRVDIYHGSASALSSMPAATLAGGSGFYLGQLLCYVGDINIDGFDDLLVGGHSYGGNRGRAAIYLGSATGIVDSVHWQVIGDQANVYFASSVDGVGDVNGDTIPDVGVGEEWLATAYVYYGIDPSAVCSVNPNVIDFGYRPNGSSNDTTFTITNQGYETITGNVSESCARFGLVGAGPYSLESGQSKEVTVFFVPSGVGYYECTIETGCDLCSDVICLGAVAAPPACAVSPTSVDFDTVVVGQSVDRMITIANNGGGLLTGTIAESCEQYSIIEGAGPYSLAAGESLSVVVRFEPMLGGQFNCLLETGDALCIDVSCSGVGVDMTGLSLPGNGVMLGYSYPNPFNPSVTIEYSIDKECFVTLAVYSVGGQLIRVLQEQWVAASEHEVAWNGRDSRGRAVPSGTYFYRLTAGDYVETKQMTLIR